jgi:hypothetical protein
MNERTYFLISMPLRFGSLHSSSSPTFFLLYLVDLCSVGFNQGFLLSTSVASRIAAAFASRKWFLG